MIKWIPCLLLIHDASKIFMKSHWLFYGKKMFNVHFKSLFFSGNCGFLNLKDFVTNKKNATLKFQVITWSKPYICRCISCVHVLERLKHAAGHPFLRAKFGEIEREIMWSGVTNWGIFFSKLTVDSFRFGVSNLWHASCMDMHVPHYPPSIFAFVCPSFQ